MAKFAHDVFLSHSTKDKAVVRPIAERLRGDGLRVWFDEWEIKPGDSIPSKIEEGLEHSRVLVLCISANAFGSDWAQLETGTFRFRDPLNKHRRFIPLRLDDASIKGSLAQFHYINWLPADRGQAYPKLLEACQPPLWCRIGAVDSEGRGSVQAESVYLFASLLTGVEPSVGTVFYRASSRATADSLRDLFAKEYSGAGDCPNFEEKSAAELSDVERVLLDEQLDWLETYDDPDQGIYDPEPSRLTILRASFSRRAVHWEGMLRSRAKEPHAKETTAERVRSLADALTELRVATEAFLAIAVETDTYPEREAGRYCTALRNAKSRLNAISGVPLEVLELTDPELVESKTRKFLHNLAQAMESVSSAPNDHAGDYPLSVKTTESVRKALKPSWPIECALGIATSSPEELRMPAEERRVSGLMLLMLLAQAYYKLLECTVSMASSCAALDLELNHSYLWVTTSLTNLLKNDENLKDFPVRFEPAFPDLYPSTIGDVDWGDMVAPDAEGFLSEVQRYVQQKGMYELEKGSPGWMFVEVLRPSVEIAIERAIAYEKRMREHVQRLFAVAPVEGNAQAGNTTRAWKPKAGGEKPKTCGRPSSGAASGQMSASHASRPASTSLSPNNDEKSR